VGEHPSVVRTTLAEPHSADSLRQQSLFQYVVPTSGRNHEKGLTKEESDFQHSPEHSEPCGETRSVHVRIKRGSSVFIHTIRMVFLLKMTTRMLRMLPR
jgi:hypothetical protein